MYYQNKQISIEVTNKCAAKCVMCPREKMIQLLDTMSQEVYEKIVTDAVNEGIELIDILGYGDAFLDRGLFEKIKFTKKLKPDMKIYLCTTGNAMIPKYFEDILKYVDIMKFSIYGVSPEVYKKTMGGLSHKKTMRNLNQFLEMDVEKKIHTVGNFVKLPENEHETKDWINLWEPKLTEICVWKPHNYVDGRKYRDTSNKKQITCGRPLEGPLNIAVNGKAHVCCFDYNKLLVVGDIKNMTLNEIMNSKELKHIQEKHKKNDFSGLICKGCDQTVHDENVLIYKNNQKREVGMDSASLHSFV